MASNAAVEKLQAVALRHGEKAVVTLAVVLFFLFVIKAITREAPIGFGPDALQKKAQQADSNLSQKQEPERILEKLVEAGIKPTTAFETTVAKQQSQALNPGDYVAKQKWVNPEPGAGLIRDQPELIAPENLYAYPNRGGYLVFATDEKGDRVLKDETANAKKRSGITPPKKRRSMGFGGMAAMGGSSRPGGSGGGGGNSAKAKEAAEKKRLDDEARLRGTLVGDVKEAGKGLGKDDAKAAAAAEAKADYKEVVKGLRSVVITGTLDNKKLRENYLAALKDPNLAYPNYKRLDVQRQTLGPDGEWTEFADVDADVNLNILDNLTEVDEELVPDDVRLEALVDPLPFPKAGYWQGVHVASLVPKEKVAPKKPAAATAGAGSSMMSMNSGAYNAAMASANSMSAAPGGSGSMSRMPNSGMMNMGMNRMGGTGAAGAAGPADETDFPKSESDLVMIRSIDFTVEQDTTYRYRVRIVVVNPNLYRANVNPGVDTESEELKSEWSDPTDDVTVPADVAAYAMKKAAAAGRRDDQVVFQIVRWSPDNGYTMTRNDEAGPGELIGQYQTTQVPSFEGKGTKAESVDFNSHRIVLDTMGGFMPPSRAINATAQFEEPALTMLLRTDGSVALRTQPGDVTDPVRDQMDKDYHRAIQESGKKRTRRRSPMGMMGSGGMR